MAETAVRLRRYLLGWKAYFRLAETPQVWRELDEWVRHRLRAIQLKHWTRGTTIDRELKAFGASDAGAHRVAANSRRWWRNSAAARGKALARRIGSGYEATRRVSRRKEAKPDSCMERNDVAPKSEGSATMERVVERSKVWLAHQRV